MTAVSTVVEVNPVVFVNKILSEIQNGFYVVDTIDGYPVEGLPNYITLFETSEPEPKNIFPSDIDTVVIEGWDTMRWLLDVQDVIVQGFSLADGTVALVDTYKSIVLKRDVAVPLDGLKASDSPTEAPKPRAKRSPKPKTE